MIVDDNIIFSFYLLPYQAIDFNLMEYDDTHCRYRKHISSGKEKYALTLNRELSIFDTSQVKFG